MGGKNASSGKQAGKSGAAPRQERLKAALKSNMARRKAQARARSAASKADKAE